MTTFWYLWSFDALVALVLLYWLFDALRKSSVSERESAQWMLLLLGMAAILCGSLMLFEQGIAGLAYLGLLLMALPAFFVLLMASASALRRGIRI